MLITGGNYGIIRDYQSRLIEFINSKEGLALKPVKRQKLMQEVKNVERALNFKI